MNTCRLRIVNTIKGETERDEETNWMDDDMIRAICNGGTLLVLYLTSINRDTLQGHNRNKIITEAKLMVKSPP